MKRQIRRLQIEFAFIFVWALVLVVLFECDWLPKGIFAGDVRAEYYMNVAGVVLLIVMVPLALKLLSLRSVRAALAQAGGNALPHRYRLWSEVRLAMLAVTGWYNLTFYYLTMNTSGSFCAAVAALALCFCWPDEYKAQIETLVDGE